jgi:hypothetical protein
MHLYEIGEQYRQFAANFEDTDDPTLKEQLKNIEGQFNDKALNIATLVVELEAETIAIKTEVDRLSNRERVAKNKIKWLRDYLLEQMLASSIEKIPGQLLTISIAKSNNSVIVLNADEVEEQFRRIIPETFEIDKTFVLSNFTKTGEIPKGLDIKTDGKYLKIK